MADLIGSRVTNLVANPQNVIGRGLVKSAPAVTKASMAVATPNLTVSSRISVCPLDWNQKIHELKIVADQLDSNGAPTLAFNVGVAVLDIKTGVVTTVNASCFGSAVTTIGRTAGTVTDVMFATAAAINNVDRTVAEVSGATTAQVELVPILILTVSTTSATAAAGDIAVVISAT